MRTILSLLALTTLHISFAQELNIPRCMSPEYIQYQESLNPGFAASVEKAFNEALAFSSNSEQKDPAPHTIPVVVHIVYNTPAQNIPDSVIYNQIQTLNEDFNRMNADTANMRPAFDIVKGNPKINFMLANIDPLGNPTNGITRTSTSTTSFGSMALLSGDFSDLEKVKSTLDGGEDPWDQSRYLNIWVCNMSVTFFGQEITALLGYATPPDNLPNWPPGSTNGMSDGVVIQYQAFGSNNPNPLDPGTGPIDVRGRTTTHEVGHYLGLRHIWGDGDCTAQDGIADTPNAADQSQQDCDTTKNTCVDNIQGIDLPDMVENFMDYSAETCQNSFTEGQVQLIDGVLALQRYDLVHNNPAALTSIEMDQLVIFPNPTNGILHIEYNGTIQSGGIYDLYGKKVLELEQFDQVDLSRFNFGVYLLELEKEDGKKLLKRIIKQ